MGLQNKHLGAQPANGASVLVIDQACDNDQLLVSLSKNGAKWLSPVGWTDQQKVTLLDCRANGETTEIDVPAEFAKDIVSGDILVLRCSELDIEKEILWEASEITTRGSEGAAPTASGITGGLLSRFKSSKPEAVESIKSEAEVRAEEADRAAQNFKAKMEAATAAKEQAQRKALEAAREAEAALKMEAERITEMERAAKAFEEAERLKQDEHRRVEEERRAEEARLAEEARRIEEARKREIAAKKEAERKAALGRYEAALDVTRNEELRLKNRLKDLKGLATSDAANNAVQQEDLQSRLGYLVDSEETVAKRLEGYEKSASKLDVMTADLSSLQSESETLGADQQAISIRLSQADTDYQQAQKEAEAAMARAEARRGDLEIIRQEENDVSGRILSVSEKLTSQNKITADASEKTQKLQAKLETAQAELTQAKLEIEALEQALVVQAEKDQNLRLEIEATQQAIEDSQAREISHRDAIEHLEAGGAPEDITEISFEARSFEPSTAFDVNETVLGAEATDEGGFKDRMMGRVRNTFAREKDAQISIDVEDVVLEASKAQADPVLLAGLDDSPSFVRRHGSSLMAVGAVIGGIAILGSGYALNKSAPSKLEVKSSTPAPTQVASAVTKVELPQIADLKEINDTPDVKAEIVPSEAALSEAAPMEIEVPITETAKVETIGLADVDIAEPETEPMTEELSMPIEAEEVSLEVKLAEVIDPTGFAFDLPNMMPQKTSQAISTDKVKNAPVVKKPSVEEITAEKEAMAQPEPVKVAAVTEIEPTAPEVVEEVVNYPELTKDIQTRLQNLGFYNGNINGVQTRDTKEAITNFKTLFSLPVDEKITGALLTELKRAERDQEAAQLLQAAEAQLQADIEAQAAVQVVEAAPIVEFYDTVQAVPSTPVVTDTLPAASPTILASDPMPAYVAPEPEPVKVASIPAVTEPVPTPVVQDVIVEAKMTRNASASYPGAAERRNYFVNANIVVAYDIDTSGRAVNLSIASNDHSGRYNDAFEKEAMKAIEKMRYEPKTINGVAVESAGKEKRIVFRVE